MLQDGSVSPPEIHSAVRSNDGPGRHQLSDLPVHEVEQDLLGAISCDHEPVRNGGLTALNQTGNATPTQNAGDQVLAPSATEILLQKDNKKGKKSHARKQPNGHIPRPRNA